MNQSGRRTSENTFRDLAKIEEEQPKQPWEQKTNLDPPWTEALTLAKHQWVIRPKRSSRDLSAVKGMWMNRLDLFARRGLANLSGGEGNRGQL